MDKNLYKKKIILICLAVLFLGGGFFLHVLLSNSCKKKEFAYINQALVCQDKLIVKKNSYAQLKSDIKDLIDERKKKGEVTSVSLYFRDLQYGPTLGMDEYENFSPASLLKLPMFLTYLQLSSGNPEFLESEISFAHMTTSLDQVFPPKYSVKPNVVYTLNTLLHHMIQYSDNQAYYVLKEFLDNQFPNEDKLRETFIDLGIIDPKNFLDETISVKSYAQIFVQLYNSTYFREKELSDEVLKVLSETDFNEGIVAGIPKDIKVAHKFGERSNYTDGVNQLHDCGIVYYPENPYLICIMTRGKDFKDLSKVIADISEMIYTEFDSRRL